MKKAELIQEINRKIPSTRGDLTIERVFFNKAENHAVISFLSGQLLGQDDFVRIKALLESIFQNMRISLRVASPALADAFRDSVTMHDIRGMKDTDMPFHRLIMESCGNNYLLRSYTQILPYLTRYQASMLEFISRSSNG